MASIMMAHEKGSNRDRVGTAVFSRWIADSNDRANTLAVIGMLGGNPTSVEFNPGTIDALGVDVATLMGSGGLTEADRALITRLINAVEALNSRLTTP